MCSPLQLMHLKEWGQGMPWAVLSRGGFDLGLTLQYHASSLWCSSLCGPLHFWHQDPWALHEKVEWSHFQQLWHWGTPGFMLVALTVAIWRPRLKEWLINNLALELFWVSHISNYMIAMSDLGEALMMCGLVARETFLKRSMCFMKSVMFSLVILLPLAHK